MAPHTVTHCINDDTLFLYGSLVTRVILNIEY